MNMTKLIILVVVFTLNGCASGGSTAPAAPAAAPGQCDVVGTWVGQVPSGMLMGRVLTMVFMENNTAQGTCQNITLNSQWQRNGNQVEVIDVSATPAFASCGPELVGRYTLEYSADCQSVTAISGEDQCTHRRQALHNFRAARQ